MGGIGDAVVDQLAKGIFRLLAKATVAGLGAILGLFDRLTEVDLARPWALGILGRVMAVAAVIGVLLLTIYAVTGALRAGWQGAVAPLGRLIVGAFWLGMVRAVLEILLQFSDALTGWLAPNFAGDMQHVMGSVTGWSGQQVPATGIVLWLVLSLGALLAVLVLGLQLLVLKYVVIMLWAIAPIVGMAAIADRGLDLVRRHSLALVAVILAKPLMALTFGVLAAMLSPAGGASLDEAAGAVVGLGVAAFAPYVILHAALKWAHEGVAASSRRAAPTQTTGRAVAASTHPWQSARRVHARVNQWSGQQRQASAAWGTRQATAARAGSSAARGAARGAAVKGAAAGAGAATAGATVAATGAATAARRVARSTRATATAATATAATAATVTPLYGPRGQVLTHVSVPTSQPIRPAQPVQPAQPAAQPQPQPTTARPATARSTNRATTERPQ